jgi:hypothetical protein
LTLLVPQGEAKEVVREGEDRQHRDNHLHLQFGDPIAEIAGKKSEHAVEITGRRTRQHCLRKSY